MSCRLPRSQGFSPLPESPESRLLDALSMEDRHHLPPQALGIFGPPLLKEEIRQLKRGHGGTRQGEVILRRFARRDR